jgi:hypothetical protein
MMLNLNLRITKIQQACVLPACGRRWLSPDLWPCYVQLAGRARKNPMRHTDETAYFEEEWYAED